MPRETKHHHVDLHVGWRLRSQRTLCGLSQTELAKQLGITFQQLQKFETGSNRMSAGQLWQTSKILSVPVSYFFEGLGGNVDHTPGVLNTRAGLEFVRDYDACPEDVRKQVYRLGKDLADVLGGDADKQSN